MRRSSKSSSRIGIEITRVRPFTCTFALTVSGGLTSAVRLINEAREDAGLKGQVIVDVHPNRPEYRGFRTQDTIVSLEADPTFEELEEAGATVNMNDTPQLLWEGWLLASGEIDRETTYELGLQRGMRFESRSGKWEEDQLIRDERFLACKIKGKLISITPRD